MIWQELERQIVYWAEREELFDRVDRTIRLEEQDVADLARYLEGKIQWRFKQPD